MSLIGRIEHLRYRRFLDASVDGELTGELARRVSAHSTACPRCANDRVVTIVIKRRLGLLRLRR